MKPVVIPVAIDLQGLYDHARVVARAFGQMADALATAPGVCTHPGVLGVVDGVTGQCPQCGHLVGIA